MARWCNIKVTFDAPVASETIACLYDDLLHIDYDFPIECLTSNDFVRYRSPIGSDEEMVAVFLKHGTSGRYWITEADYVSDPNWPEDAEESDADCVVFRPGVALDSVSKAHAAAVHVESIRSGAERWVAVTKAFQVPALPVNWEAARLLHIYAASDDQEAFVEVVKQLLEKPDG